MGRRRIRRSRCSEESVGLDRCLSLLSDSSYSSSVLSGLNASMELDALGEYVEISWVDNSLGGREERAL